MELGAHTVLVTGGASGIGLALAKRFLNAGSDVIICGRREQKLREAQRAHPGFATRVCDVANPADRESLAAWATREYPSLDVVVHNAGIQRRVKLTEPDVWAATQEEIAINLAAPVHLTSLLLPHLMTRKHAAIIMVTSGLAFVPLAGVPVYCATKAALHSFTLSLRHQLRETPVEVIEIMPPAVDTDLGGPGLHTFGVNVDEFADAAMAGVQSGATEIPYGFAVESSRATREQRDAIFARMNPLTPHGRP